MSTQGIMLPVYRRFFIIKKLLNWLSNAKSIYMATMKVILLLETPTNNSIKKSGRPKKMVDEKQVKSLLRLGFKWKKMPS